MTERQARPKVVKVLLWLSPERDTWGAGIITQEWQGATRVDRRLSASHAMPVVGSVPEGCDEHVYLAWVALGEYISASVKGPGEGAW